MSSSSSEAFGAGGRFWRKTKLGSQDYTLRDPTEEETEGVEGIESVAQGASTEYRTYKRRWFGFVQLTLLNIIVSWDVR
jgi:MFS transporter, FLVCR family, MFS-domain-containing protein 7